MARVLIVDDEVGIRESLAYALERDGFAAVQAANLAEAGAALDDADLVVLDLMLPDGSGLDFLTRLRGRSAVPVIVLTSRAEETDRVVGLELGADDYVLKPFSPRELVARVRAVLRRAGGRLLGAAPAARCSVGELYVDVSRRTAGWGETPIELSKTEFDLLLTLLGAPGRVFDRQQLLRAVWGAAVNVGERTVDAHIKSLRRRIRIAGGDSEVVETIRGVGYRLRERG